MRDIQPGSVLKAAKDSVLEHTLRGKNTAHNHQTPPTYTFAELFLRHSEDRLQIKYLLLRKMISNVSDSRTWF